MSIIITVEEVVVRGEKKMKLIKIEGLLRREQLPIKYFDQGNDYIWLEDNYIFRPGVSRSNIHLNNFITDADIENIRRCADRLREINKQLAKENANWNRIKTFVI